MAAHAATGRWVPQGSPRCVTWPSVLTQCLVGENIHRHPMSLKSLEYQVSELVNSDTCPRPTTPISLCCAAPLGSLPLSHELTSSYFWTAGRMVE